MSFLAPLYFAGALAVALPTIFHLIRRAPRGRVEFSSLLFLKPTPPRVTRRSKLDNWLLFLLRAGAILLLALAFARPFLRETDLLSLHVAGKKVAILLDTSASMKRGDLWSRAKDEVETVLSSLSSNDEVSLYTYDDQVQARVGFGATATERDGDALSRVRKFLEDLEPSWGASALGAALVSVAEELRQSVRTSSLEASASDESSVVEAELEIVLVSDLQEGSELESLEVYDWPEGVRLDVRRLSVEDRSNASLALLSERVDRADERQRIRVSNDEASSVQKFSLFWAGSSEDEAAATVHVPPGESRVIRLDPPKASPGSHELVLRGDQHDFDNSVFVLGPSREEIVLTYVGAEGANDTAGLRFYLERAITGDARRSVEIRDVRAGEPLPKDQARSRLTVLTGVLDQSLVTQLREYAENGGTLLYVLKSAADAKTAGAILDAESFDASEAPSRDYSMFGELDFGHPLFARFADPRYSDFTKIRFWKRRHLRWGDDNGSLRVIASFDDKLPAVVEQRVGRGLVYVFASGWHPKDSQLALSTKFVPMLHRMLEGRGSQERRSQFRVSEAVPVVDALLGHELRVRSPAAEDSVLAAEAKAFESTQSPGAYSLSNTMDEQRFVVNLAPRESRVEALDVTEMESR
ncbi:MAG: BatA domain-containing protein, partial [Planctomycetota bacterium]